MRHQPPLIAMAIRFDVMIALPFSRLPSRNVHVPESGESISHRILSI
jgi:hypothetical protein